MDVTTSITAVGTPSGEVRRELPESWSWIPLGEIVEIHDHRRRPIKAQDRQTRIQGKSSAELFPYYGATGQVGLIDGFLFDFPAILLGEDGAPFLDRQRAKAYAVEGNYWVNNHAHILTPKGSVLARWLLHSLNFVDYEPHVGGTTRLKLTKGDLEQIPIPLAPLPEQRRIVARIDELFAEIAAGEAALADARKGLETFRRALLKAAVTGELTRDWRTNQPTSESGDDVLKRIGKNAASNGRKRRIASAAQLDTSDLPTLPETWSWAQLGELGEIVGGITVDKKRKPETAVTVPYLRVANVQRGHIDLSEVKSIVVERTSAERLRLQEGDLLLNEGGDRDKIGRGWVWDGSIPDMIHQNHVFRVRLNDKALNSYFVSHYANELGRRFFVEQGKQTTNLASISLSKVMTLPVPVPPPAETEEIVRRVSEALSIADDTLAQLDAEAADAARLEQAILKSAFEGRLVPQDPADEPASALLARIAPPTSGSKGKRRGRKA
ncbi:restriction endonuclease subunit S [Bradyrhizobium sp. SZCCHNRI1009]|uniref:restriction endonuclease subunit S n=1 Tax=Bradyrhizobium sp. SZCCHNRI1009 TaxID=3057277 RepID=UPI0029164C5B|nr:restriction endonuclease subunit S [Bradyrhizobium sp. SZCCHNRI1009]